MAYLILSSKGREITRRQLDGPLTIGRSADCGLAIRDVLLSRHHCRIEPAGGGWVVIDLGSKNGTWLDGQPVGRRGLRYGDELRAGKTTIRLAAGNLPADDAADPQGGSGPKARPADPFEAMAGTVAGALLDQYPSDSRSDDRSARPFRPARRFPTPRPVPPEPAAYARDDVYSMLSEIASSSWDSIYANASRPTRPAARVVAPAGMERVAVAAVASQPAPSRRASDAPRASTGRSRADLSLQAPAERPGRPLRPARPPVPSPLPAEQPGVARGAVLRWGVAVVRLLARVRRKIAPRGAVLLF